MNGAIIKGDVAGNARKPAPSGNSQPRASVRLLPPLALTGAKRVGSSLQRLELDGRFEVLRGLYWQLRYLRRGDTAGRRRLYRAISVERKKFDGTAFDAELLRLFCRFLACPGDLHAERRYLMRLSSHGQD